ncbi:MAG TPA: hypothetical protein VJV39_23170 [Dongiaceae bacterium]|nr:hypothetical protein [Dongiaceae bacterium]
MPAGRAISAAIVALLALATPSGADEQAPPDLLTDPAPFEIGYGMSFYDFDACGDAEAGRILRRAIVEKLERCPFSRQARAEFDAWRLETAEELASRLLSNQDGIPVGPPEVTEPAANGRPMTCERYRSTQHYVDRRADLLRYANQEIPVDQLLGEDCPSGPASL